MAAKKRIESFRLREGQPLGDRYVVLGRLGTGWEGEAYEVEERKTRVRRAAKLFFPHRNLRDRAVRHHARKLDRLRDCSIIVKYHHSETVVFGGLRVTALISELVEGVLLDELVRRQRGGRLPSFEALHVLHSLARGLEQVHALGEYHGDVHAGNILVRRRGAFFDTKLIDLYHWGRSSAANMREDVISLIRVLYDALGGRRRYASLPPEIKAICLGLRRDLIARRFPRAGRLREHLERFTWEAP